MNPKILAPALACSAALVFAFPPHAASQESNAEPELQPVAKFPKQQVTGVTVSKDGRIFVNFPRWEQDVPISVAEILPGGKLRPYPDEKWNAWRNAKPLSPEDHWVTVQSVVMDNQGFLWILDPAAPASQFVIPGGPKLVKIDLAKDEAVKTIRFDETAAPQGSYLNDVRFSPDGNHAYITDSGPESAIVVVNLKSGDARRLLQNHKTTQPEPDVIVHVDGKEVRRPDGRKVKFSSDGIALSPDGEHLYWQALTGRTLYRLPTEALEDADLPASELEAKIETVGENGVSDGLWMDKGGRMYISALEENAIKAREPDGRVWTVLKDKRLSWPDTFAEGADGSIYVTTSQIQNMAQFHDKGSTQTEPYGLWKFEPPKEAPAAQVN